VKEMPNALLVFTFNELFLGVRIKRLVFQLIG